MTLEEYTEERRKRVANMTLAQARDLIAKTLDHSDMGIEFDKAVWMLLDCADEKINEKTKTATWIRQRSVGGYENTYECSGCGRVVYAEDKEDLEDFPYCHCGCKMEIGGVEDGKEM